MYVSSFIFHIHVSYLFLHAIGAKSIKGCVPLCMYSRGISPLLKRKSESLLKTTRMTF